MSASIFISFAAPDRKVASTLCKALESRGFKCWFSSRDILPGENFQVAIVRAIRKARVLLLVFTGNSNASEEMTKELALASQERLIVVPLRVEDVAPNEAFAYEFATRQWIDFFADWEAAIDQLSDRLAQALPPESQPDPAMYSAKGDPSARAQALAAAPTMKLAEAREPEPVTPAPVTATPAAAASVVARATVPAEAPPAAAPPAAAPAAEVAPIPVKEPPAKEPPVKEPPPKPVAEAPAPKAAPPKPAKSAPPPVDTPQLVRDSIRAEAPLDGPAVEPKKRTGLLAIAAVVVVALIGLGLAAPALFGKKPPAAKPGVAALAVAAPPKPAAPAPLEAAAPVDEAADAAADAEPEPVKVAPKPKKKAAPKPKEDEVPY